MNLNTLFDKLTNFKIKFTKDPSPTQVSNMGLKFVLRYKKFRTYHSESVLFFNEIELNPDTGVVEIVLE